MEVNHLNSLRLGFSTKHAATIQKVGLASFISNQLETTNSLIEPKFIANSPKNLKQLNELKNKSEKGGKELEKVAVDLLKLSFEFKAFILERCFTSENPLREKINLFFQNHFVSTLKSVKVPFWIYKHYETINSNALGNYKTLVKEMVYSNAMIKYLDNQQNKNGAV